jgi:hypothetical protein
LSGRYQQCLDAGDQTIEPHRSILFQGQQRGVYDLFPLRRQAGKIHKDYIGYCALKVSLYDTFPQSHGRREGNELPIVIEDLTDSDVRGARVRGLEFHLRGS